MKTSLLTLAVALAVAATSFAGPIHKENVAADAKWLLHLDVDNLLQTGIGKYFAESILDKELGKAKRDIQQQFGVEFDWRQIQSITAYGTQIKPKGDPGGVLLIEGYDFAAALDAVIDRLQAALAGADQPLKKVAEGKGAFYSLKDEVFGVALPGNLFLVSKSKDEVQKARDVVTGAAPSFKGSKDAARLPDPAKAGFLFGLINSLDSAPLPPQAKGLKNVEGAQVVMGEQAENVFVKLALNAKDAESATQMQQALQGLLALVTITQPDNKSAQKLVQAAKVTGAEKVVTVKLDLPASDVIDLVKEGQAKKASQGEQPRKARRAKKPAAE
jgi:hypothetical protein